MSHPGPFFGQFDPPLDKVLFERYFEGRQTPGVCIECGAFDGVTDSTCKFFEDALGWTAINVEPYPWAFERLTRNRPNATNLKAALSNQDGCATFTAAIHPRLGPFFGNGSLSHQPAHRSDLEAMGCQFESYEVETLTYRRLLDSCQIEEVDLLVLDVEGHELEVLRGFDCVSLERRPRICCIEHGSIGLNALRGAMHQLGYVFDGSAEVNSFFLRGDFSEIAGALFRHHEPGLAWDATQMEATLVGLWKAYEKLTEGREG